MISDFSPRLGQITLNLLMQDSPVSVKYLADSVGVSKRTVQRELEYIESSLKKYNLSFQSKAGTGVWIEGDKSDKEKLTALLMADDTLDVSNKDERIKKLILELLKESEPQKLFYYANMLGVSEATVSNDLDEVAKWFDKFKLSLVRKQGFGIYLEGKEKAYRKALTAFIDEYTSSYKLTQNDKNTMRESNLIKLIENKSSKNIYSLLDTDIMKRVISCLINLNNEQISNLTDSSYAGLVIHITIAINRIMHNEIIDPDSRLDEYIEHDRDYSLAVIIASSLEKEFNIEIPEIEVTYICLHIRASKMQNTSSSKGSRRNNTLVSLVYEMIESYDPDISYILEQDDAFIDGLIAHMQPTLVRLTNGLAIRNPLLDQIKSDYPDIFEKCKNVTAMLEDKLNLKVPESETGFLAVHFGAAVVRLEQNNLSKRTVYVGVVCASGIGISRFIKTKLEKVFGNRISIETYGKGDIDSNAIRKTDFFVSNINMEVPDGADIIFINPLITDSDIKNIDANIRRYEITPDKSEDRLDFYNQLDLIHNLTAHMKMILENFNIKSISRDIDFEKYLDVLRDKLIDSDDNSEIILSDIVAREKIATQVFPEMGFALFHTKTSGTKHIRMSVCISDGNSFENEYFKGISCIITMLLPDDKHLNMNRKLLGFISEMLIEDPAFLEVLNSEDVSVGKDYLSKILKKYLKSIIN
ncbi:BglG family transcription antiterminator [Peptacetobacter sp.]|uniref:BglG family transcription antiterminator n=1 Tax=Peptacetobacter sp. TaxID=2991975 RepID=UPI002E7755AF|nr:BglG family transcription antiterminator [Peptacetobacter sp.]MEE0452100.1 BglG family transcription antiterminator [Peptacetobacter sp.]